MKKKIFFILSLLNLSMHSANVFVVNNTKEVIYARINKQNTFLLTPNFRAIAPNNSIVLTTAWRRPLVNLIKKEMDPSQTTLGKSIKTITFARVAGSKQIVGTPAELRNIVYAFGKKYGNASFNQSSIDNYSSRKENHYFYTFKMLIEQQVRRGTKYDDYTITVPIMQEFTYTLPKGGIQKGIVELQSWGNAEFSPAPK